MGVILSHFLGLIIIVILENLARQAPDQAFWHCQINKSSFVASINGSGKGIYFLLTLALAGEGIRLDPFQAPFSAAPPALWTAAHPRKVGQIPTL